MALLRYAFLAASVLAIWPSLASSADGSAHRIATASLGNTAGVASVQPRVLPAVEQQPDVDRSLKAMVGQMILLAFPGTSPTQEGPARVVTMIKEGRIGGVVLFSDNIENPAQVTTLIASLAADSHRPKPFICVDQEGGAIKRLTSAKGFFRLPSAARVALTTEDSAYSLYLSMARELSDLGFNVNFGPVVDLNINPDSPAIGRLGRTYDQAPAKVTAYASQFIKAHEKAGVLTVLKHFPGHGSALADSHDGIVNISKTWRFTELDPYKDLIAGNFVQVVMVGHLIHPLFSDNGDRPASLSRLAITDTLRGALGFRGLVVTDDLNMRAIREHYAIEEAAAMAVAAGSDLILVADQSDPAIAGKITEAILGAITDGRISVSQIEEAYARITKAKSELVPLSSNRPPLYAGVGR